MSIRSLPVATLPGNLAAMTNCDTVRSLLTTKCCEQACASRTWTERVAAAALPEMNIQEGETVVGIPSRLVLFFLEG